MSEIILTDEQIEHLLTTPKQATTQSARWKAQRGSRQKNYELETENGNLKFSLYLRQNLRIADSFSCGLLYLHPAGDKVTLTRYNGSDHDHYNPLDGTKSHAACHIHRATERYMSIGRKAEHYAESTTRYRDLDGALRALIEDCTITGIHLANPAADDDNDDSNDDQLNLELQ